jgi:hypothetical protein
MEIVKSFKDKVLSTRNKQKPKKKNPKKQLKIQKNSFTSNFKVTATSILFEKLCL